MMQTSKVLFAMFLALGPSVGACQANKPAATAKASQNASGPAIIHHFNETTTLIEHGDTLSLISPSKHVVGVPKLDTLVYVFRGDSVAQITRKGPIPMPAHLAVVLRRFVDAARQQDQTEAVLGHPIR